MVSREDFIFSVGYEGNLAIVNAAHKRAFGRLSTGELAEKGLYKAAVSSAVYHASNDELESVLSIYNEANEKPIESIEALKRTFGVLDAFDTIERVMYI